MAFFDGKRISPSEMDIDTHLLRRGWYSDKYFLNTARLLHSLSRERYQYDTRIDNVRHNIKSGDIEVEAQIFNRRNPFAVVAGVDHCLAQLNIGAGKFITIDPSAAATTWVSHRDRLKVVAVHDGAITLYHGEPLKVMPVIKIRGPYSSFAHLETTMLGVLSRASRIATNTFHTYQASRGKPIYFFPARFDMQTTQAIDGYAYWIGGNRYASDSGAPFTPHVSTDEQAHLWDGKGMGTIAHSTIACFAGDTEETMVQFARHMPIDIPRVVLADFNNDCIRDSLNVLRAYWDQYKSAVGAQSAEEIKRWVLYGIRLDTSSALRDNSLPDGAERGVTPQLVFAMRRAINNAWEGFTVRREDEQLAKDFCRNVKIIVSGGFKPEKIRRFEEEGAPVDAYAVGSSLLKNDSATNCDYTMDIVKIKSGGNWHHVSKVGRMGCANTDLEEVVL